MESHKELTVCITGAAGQIAYSLIGMVCSGQVFGPNTTLHIRLLDIEPAMNLLKGLVLELEDCAYPLVKSIQSGHDAVQIFKDIDVGIFLGGFPRKPGMERKDLLQTNNKIFKEQGKALSQSAKPTCKVVVVANPANTNCLTLALNCPNIPKKNFTALTRLDHNRALAQLANKAGVQVSQVQNVIIWGNHSTTQYPDIRHGTINGKPIKEVISNDYYLENEFIVRVQKRGGEVLAARNNSSVMSAANAVKDHLHTWFFGTKEGQWVSMGVVTQGTPYGIQDDLVFSFPVKCHNFEWEIVKDLQIDEFSQNKLKITLDELKEEKQEAFSG